MNTTITTDAIGKKYGIRGNVLYRCRRRLIRLEYVGKRVGGKRSRTYELLRSLPGSTEIIRSEYNVTFNVFYIRVVAEEVADEVEGLRDELQQWMDGMEVSDGLMGTQTYEQVVAALGELDQIDADALREVPTSVAGQGFVHGIYFDPYLSRGWARWQRGARAASLLDRAAEAADEHAGEWASAARDASMVLESVVWPTMYGG